MIIIQLIGGLGNQMFQYAAGRAIACRNNTCLKLDTSLFENYMLRSYRLDCFNIVENFATNDEIKHLKPDRSQLFSFCLNKLRQKITPWHEQNVIIEHAFDFDPDVLKITGNAYIKGYWQSEKYFFDIAEIIRKDFTFKRGPDEVNKNILSTILRTNSVSLHIRRGDYVSNPETMETHGVLGIDYYLEALNFIENNVKDPEIFIFSDEISWAKANVRSDLPLHFIDHNGPEKDYEDLRLMINCKHHIIANSSFSWWGAWLGKNEGNLIVAPAKWFNTKCCNYDDLFPAEWLIIN
jgi:hypothetical protein